MGKIICFANVSQLEILKCLDQVSTSELLYLSWQTNSLLWLLRTDKTQDDKTISFIKQGGLEDIAATLIQKMSGIFQVWSRIFTEDCRKPWCNEENWITFLKSAYLL